MLTVTTTVTCDRQVRCRIACLIGSGCAWLLLLAAAWAQPGALVEFSEPEIDLGPPPVRRPPSAAELNEVRILFEDFDEQVRIATAKLDPDALQRKREIGRLRAILAESDQQIQLLAAKIQRLQERQDQFQQDQASRGSAPAAGIGGLPLETGGRLQQRLSDEQARLEQLGRQRSRVKQKLDELYDRHIQILLDAGMPAAGDMPLVPGGLERLLQQTLGEAASAGG